MGKSPVLLVGWSLKWRNELLEPETEPKATIEEDSRRRVPSRDFLPDDSKFHSVVKINFERYDGWMSATGYLLSDDIVATAGHNIYDPSAQNGSKLQRAFVYVGYRGKTHTRGLQKRTGAKAFCYSSWYFEKDPVHDVAFIKLKTPFENITPIEFTTTPRTGNGLLVVVGYPNDRASEGGENGAIMYKGSLDVSWNIDKFNGLLRHWVSTANGNSGSPVFWQQGEKLIVIGTHTNGGDLPYGSPIETDSANSFKRIVTILSKEDLTPCGCTSGVDVYHRRLGNYTPSKPIAHPTKTAEGATCKEPHEES